MPSKPLRTLAVLAVTTSLAFAQQPAAPPAPPAATTPAGPPAPIERRPAGPDQGPGMGPRSGGMRHGPANFHGPQGEGMSGGFHIVPPGVWWRDPLVVQRLTLTPEQTKKMDDIFQRMRLQLIDLKANLERQNTLLEPMLRANPIDFAKTSLQIDKVAGARAELERNDAKMLLSIRGVLTPDQWTRLQDRGRMGRGPGGPGAGQGPGGRQGPRGGGMAPAGGEELVAPEPQP